MPGPRLSIVSEEEQLRGGVPGPFEKIARSAKLGSPEHRALVATSLAIAADVNRRCLPPSGLTQLAKALAAGWAWLDSSAQAAGPLADVQSLRADVFGAAPALEKLAGESVAKALALSPPKSPTLIDDHAASVVERYARLSAHHAVAALCHALDTCGTPDSALIVFDDAAGADAYLKAGLGAARHPTFRQTAIDQAGWEAARQLGREAEHSELGSLAIQNFHEFLGARWRAQGDAARARLYLFIEWVLSGRR